MLHKSSILAFALMASLQPAANSRTQNEIARTPQKIVPTEKLPQTAKDFKARLPAKLPPKALVPTASKEQPENAKTNSQDTHACDFGLSEVDERYMRDGRPQKSLILPDTVNLKMSSGNESTAAIHRQRSLSREAPRDTNIFQVKPTILDERYMRSGRAERSLKLPGILPAGAPIPDSISPMPQHPIEQTSKSDL